MTGLSGDLRKLSLPAHPHRPSRAHGSPDPNMQPHVLVITGDTADEREFEIEHPNCPLVCHWSPHSREFWEKGCDSIWSGSLAGEKVHTDEGRRSCYVEHEVENIGLDALDLGVDPPDDGTYAPESQWSMDGWRRLPPGRYIIEGWYTPQGWAGSEPVDADGGLTFMGRVPVNAYWCTLEGRIVGRSYDPPDPGEYTVPCGIYLAETRGRAKLMLIADHGRDVDAEEFIDVRTRILARELNAPAGPLAEPKPGDPVYEAMVDGGDPPAESLYARLWLRVHEVEEHGGAKCDCPGDAV